MILDSGQIEAVGCVRSVGGERPGQDACLCQLDRWTDWIDEILSFIGTPVRARRTRVATHARAPEQKFLGICPVSSCPVLVWLVSWLVRCGRVFAYRRFVMKQDHPLYWTWRSRSRDRVARSLECSIDDRWATFESFIMNPPRGDWFVGAVLCRDGDTGPYSPENCRWDTRAANASEAHKGKPKTQEQIAKRTASRDGAAIGAKISASLSGRMSEPSTRGWETRRKNQGGV